MDKIHVVQSGEKDLQYSTGVGRRQVFESESGQVIEIRVTPGLTGGWHHHGKRTMYGFVVAGKFAMDFNPDQKERVVLSKGDFFLIPPELVHRDVNPNAEEATIMIFNIGPGPATIEAVGPKD
jgi:quercetin dioxygenase-like cupin family protein